MGRTEEEAFEEARRLLAEVGCFCRGTILRRLMPCGKAGCRCQANPPRLHGPYYQWTRKVKGKTVTRRVSAAEAKVLRRWIASARRFDVLATRVEAASGRVLDRILAEGRQSARKPNK